MRVIAAASRSPQRGGTRRGLEIAFFGSKVFSASGNGAAVYHRGILRALAARGHRIRFFDPDPAGVGAALAQARNADLVVKASGMGPLDALLERGVLEARRPGARAIYWDVDASATLDRIFADPRDRFRAIVGAYDLVLTYGGGEPVRCAYRALGARECVPIYDALDPETHHPTGPDPRFLCDLAFLGDRRIDLEARVDELFFRAAAALPARRFLLGGVGWQEKTMAPNIRYRGQLGRHEHNALHCTATCVLNVKDPTARDGFSPVTRVLEAAGAGACILTDAFVGLEQFLEPEREVLVARSGAEVATILDRLDPARAAAIGSAARRRLLAQHTYAHRAAQVEALLGRGPAVGAVA
jgi:spore maturation protein CgeB